MSKCKKSMFSQNECQVCHCDDTPGFKESCSENDSSHIKCEEQYIGELSFAIKTLKKCKIHEEILKRFKLNDFLKGEIILTESEKGLVSLDKIIIDIFNNCISCKEISNYESINKEPKLKIIMTNSGLPVIAKSNQVDENDTCFCCRENAKRCACYSLYSDSRGKRCVVCK